jgi:hypothetical protein
MRNRRVQRKHKMSYSDSVRTARRPKAAKKKQQKKKNPLQKLIDALGG